jgi:hypothetical protein
MLESDTCFGCGELPIGLGVVGVSILLPSGDFINEGLLVWDAAIKALGRKDAGSGEWKIFRGRQNQLYLASGAGKRMLL